MRYRSTRGGVPKIGPEEVLLAGLAADGGLYLPESWPHLGPGELDELSALSYAALTARLLTPYFEPFMSGTELHRVAKDVYARFDHPQVAPLIDLGEGLWLLELFHGPTLAFKDFALQLLARLLERLAGQSDRPLVLLGATSGDTGAAAVHAFKDMNNITLHMLHPEGCISEMQRRQMTTIKASNIRNYAVRGSFDDCQAMVKELLRDPEIAERANLSTVNSINWGRIAAQIPYYFFASLKLASLKLASLKPGSAGDACSFAVPSGNFGNCFSAFAASRMGLPVENFIVGVNDNDGLRRAFEDGRVERRATRATISPAMDIQLSSNFERLLLELSDRNAEKVRLQMKDLLDRGNYDLDENWLARARARFRVYKISEDTILSEIKGVADVTGIKIDPHTAVGTAAARSWIRGGGQAPVICLATAHPAKFSDTIEKAIGVKPDLPACLAGLAGLSEVMTSIDASGEALKKEILKGLRP